MKVPIRIPVRGFELFRFPSAPRALFGGKQRHSYIILHRVTDACSHIYLTALGDIDESSDCRLLYRDSLVWYF